MMQREDIHKSAEAFVNDQIGIMKEYGSDPQLTSDQYGSLVDAAERNLSAIASLKQQV